MYHSEVLFWHYEFTMSETILYLSFIGGLVRPLVTAHSRNLVAAELSLVDGTIRPVECSFAVQKTVLQLTFIGVSVSELASSLSVINLADLLIQIISNRQKKYFSNS